MSIQRLPSNLINQIAAGEVVERPAAVVKELVENSLDAGASTITVTIRNGGQSLIQVTDNGQGIASEELPLALERYATSKLPHEDLFNIQSFGFRGEALSSIGAVSRLHMTSCAHNADQAWSIEVEGGTLQPAAPAKHPQGTTVSVQDLFYATPARLKFMRSPVTEMQHIQDTLKKIALAHPDITFVLKDDTKTLFSYTGSLLSEPFEQFLERAVQVLGEEFRTNACLVDHTQDNIRVWGLAGIPTYNRANGNYQYLYVNQRPVKDKILPSVLRVAYQDYLARDRFPVAVLFVDLPSDEVDVNVHPAKTEVRFRDGNVVRSSLYHALKDALNGAAQRTSTTIHAQAIQRFQTAAAPTYQQSQMRFAPRPMMNTIPTRNSTAPDLMPPFTPTNAPNPTPAQELHLGRPLGQAFDTYVISEGENCLFVIDQHAAHERLVYEKMKIALQSGEGVRRQMLLIPHIVPLNKQQIDKLLSVQAELLNYGLGFQVHQDKSIVVTEVPMILKDLHVEQLVSDLLDELDVHNTPMALKEALETLCGTFACHGSIRAGKKMSLPEMDALLRQMEETPYSGQCNHGRPTYIRLAKCDIETLFHRR